MPRHVTTRDGQRLWRDNAAQTLGLCPGATSAFPAIRDRFSKRAVDRPTSRSAALLLAVATLIAASTLAGNLTAFAASNGQSGGPVADQFVTTRPEPTANPKALAAATEDDRMLVVADQSVYDRPSNAVTLIGKVQIYYKRSTLQADQVVYYTETKRVVATGHVRLTEPSGNLLHADKMDVTQGFQTGFVEALRIDSVDRTRFESTSAERKEGNITIFKDGVYSACQYCEVTSKLPFWEIRASKITHNETEKTVEYENAELMFDGTPVAYLPYFQHADPTVTRQTGFLLPTYSASTNLGLTVSAPFYWAPTKDWDATLQPAYLTRQGFLGDFQVRHAFENGTVTVRAIGINQTDPSAFLNTSGNRVERGALMSTGQFRINENWKWGWDTTLISDRRFLLDYHENTTSSQDATSQVYLTGLGERTYFDARAFAFQIFTDDDPSQPKNTGLDLQNKQPGASVIDYDMVFGEPVWGGELSAKYNVTNLYRAVTDIGLANQVYGIAGEFSRASIDVNWRRSFTDSYGQVFEPFAYVRGDIFYNNESSQANGVGVNWLERGSAFRGMPAIGLEYRYPWLMTSVVGNHILEPIAQLIVRPNETLVGKLPNEDAQSLVFDDTTLFQPDKFSGFDRAEGGTRANLGLQYTYQIPRGGYVTALFGRSFQLTGDNSFGQPQLQALETMARAGEPVPLSALGSGLGKSLSDYVARLNLDTGAGVRIGTSERFASGTFELRRADFSLSGTAGPLTSSLTWAYLRTPQSLYNLINAYDPTLLTNYPNLLQSERSELQGTVSLKVNENWRLFGGSKYDLKNKFAISDLVGFGYDNDSFSTSLTFSANTNVPTTQFVTNQVLTDRTIYLKFGFRTLGDGSISNGSSANSTGSNSTGSTGFGSNSIYK